MCSRVYKTVERPSVRPSVCPSVCMSQLLTVAAACGGFAAVGPAGKGYRSIAAAAGRRSSTAHRSTACSSKREQCYVVSRRRKLKPDLFHACCVVMCQRVLLGSGVRTARTSVVATWMPAIAAKAVHHVATFWRDGPVRTAIKISTSVKMQGKSAAQTPTAETPTDHTLVTVTLGISGTRTNASVSIKHSSILIPILSRREALFMPVTGYAPFGNYGLVVCLTVVCISKILIA